MSDREPVGKCEAPESSEGLLVPTTVAAPLRQGLHAVPCTVRHTVPCTGRTAVNTPTETCSRRLCLEVSGVGMQGEGGQETPLQ